MTKLGLIREGKIPVDNRVALTPKQLSWIKNNKNVEVKVQSSNNRCFSDKEYRLAGIEVVNDVSDCDILLGIKEVPPQQLIEGKTYLFFSHTKKMQPHNRDLIREIIKKRITIIDYECLEHTDGTRIIGFGFFAGVVGAHNAMVAYGNRTGLFKLDRIDHSKSFQSLIHTYFGLKLPNIKIAVTGSGRVAHGVLEIMNLLGVHEVEPDDFCTGVFDYPVYVHLKGADLYARNNGEKYVRTHFHENPAEYHNLFRNYIPYTDVLINGVYWAEGIPRLFEKEDVQKPDFNIQTIGDITDDEHGSVPINISASTIEDFLYGVNRQTLQKTEPYLSGSIDVMAVGNLPNELPKDASRYFGEQLIKYVLDDLLNQQHSEVIEKATIVKQGILTDEYSYLKDYAGQ